jgi:spore coat polysaccharide biosynthesis protein SpsF
MKTVATIEARMTSSRLPGKVLLSAAGKTMLQHLIDRLKLVPELDEIVLATTTNVQDDELVDVANNNQIKYFRGSEEDVLGRVLEAAKSVNADTIVEITADCPVIDSGIISQCIKMYYVHDCDYASNAIHRCYPDGMDVQVFSVKTLEETSKLTLDPLDREHVSLYIKNHPDTYKQIHLMAPSQLHWPELGLTLDEKDDYKLLKKIIEYFYAKDTPTFNCYDIISLLEKEKSWQSLNVHVLRKENS